MNGRPHPLLWTVLLPFLAGCAALPTKGGAQTERSTVATLLRAPPARRYLVCAHRGSYFAGSLAGGGNTRHALDVAWRAGADLIEVDVERTADGVPVIAHDPWPRERPFAAWQACGRTLLSLTEALAWANGRIVLLLDLKTDQVAGALRTVEGAGARDRVLVLADTEEERRRVASLAPTLGQMARPRNREDALALAGSSDPSLLLVHVDPEWADPALIAAVQASGRRVFANSWRGRLLEELTGSDLTAGALFDRGIDVVQTNDPAGAARARDARNLAVPP